MKKFLIVVTVLVILSSLAFAKLSDEVLENVERLRAKHYGYRCFSDTKSDIKWSGIEWTSDFLTIEVEGDKLIIETQDGEWYIEMEKVTE